MGVKGKMWRVVKGMYEVSRSTVLLDGEKSNMFSVEQGVQHRVVAYLQYCFRY